jgi:hypothetical protein
VWPVLAFAVMAVARWGASFSPPLVLNCIKKVAGQKFLHVGLAATEFLNGINKNFKQ